MTKILLNKYVLIVMGLLAASLGLYYALRKNTESTTIHTKDADANEQKAYLIASQIVSALNTSKGSSNWNPANWGENEDLAIKLLNENGTLTKLIESYYNKLSKSGSLVNDLNSLLTSSQRAKLMFI